MILASSAGTQDWLEVAALLSQIVGIPLAAWAIVMGRADARRAREVDVMLHLLEAFREKWESRWRESLEQIEIVRTRGAEPLRPVDEGHLYDMLNWVDWLGRFLRSGFLGDHDLVLDGLEVQIRRIIDVGRAEVLDLETQEGTEYWAGVRQVSQRLDCRKARGAAR